MIPLYAEILLEFFISFKRVDYFSFSSKVKKKIKIKITVRYKSCFFLLLVSCFVFKATHNTC